MPKPKSRPFSGQVKCPHPDCPHVGSLITKVHCRMHHNMEREELFKKFGEPIPLRTDPAKLKALNQWKKEENDKFTTAEREASLKGRQRSTKKSGTQLGGDY